MKYLKSVSVLIVGMMIMVAAALPASAQSKLERVFDETDAFLSKYAEDGHVDYQSAGAQPAQLDALVRMIGNVSLDSAAAAQKKAFYVNAYNILTIHSIIENGIPESPRDVNGFWDGQTHEAAGSDVTLDEIEKRILFPEFGDPRLHFALVCAAKGCPPLQPHAYRPGSLDQQLDEVTRKAMNDPYFIRVDKVQEQARVSQIFEWYETDFLQITDSVREYINRYRSEPIPSEYEIGYYDYDWSLNSTGR